MQTYVVVMIVLVVAGTLFDVWHKGSATYFFAAWRKSRDKGARQVGGGTMTGIAIQTALSEGLTSAEFGPGRRRIAHLLTMYGFLAYVVHHRHHGVLVPDAGHGHARHPAARCGPSGP